MLPLLHLPTTSDTLIMTLLNLRSLKKHSDDMLIDIYLSNKDELCLRKTQVHLDKNRSEITWKFQNNSRMYSNSNIDNYVRVLICEF